MIVMAAPTGARRSKADHPALPITVPDVIETTRACVAAGANALHLHIRDDDGLHSIDPGRYAEALAEIAAQLPGLRVQVTTEAAGLYDTKVQLALVETLKPAWTTIALREAARDQADARRMYETCETNGTEIQHIVFDASDADLLRGWQDAGVLGPEESVILVLGRYTDGQVSDPAALDPLLSALPPVGRWMLCAFGPTEHACLRRAAALGGDVRVGFENSYLQADGTPWPDMAASVAALCQSLG